MPPEFAWLYVYLLLEFQSTVDTYMAVRIQTYVGLLYEGLMRSGQLTPGGRLPPVVPIVLYNGRGTWTAALDVAESDRCHARGAGSLPLATAVCVDR